MPTCVGSQIKGPNSRIDLLKKHAGIDIVAMYPVGGPPKAEAWTLDAMLKAAEACHKGGNPFGIGLGTTEDNVDTAGAIFQSFGAELVDAKGTITVKSDKVRQALEYYKKLAQWLPPDAPAWDNAANNKYLISGKGSLIMNPPSAWAVAKRDAPQVAEQLWTHGMPSGPVGRYAPFLPYFWAIWSFGKNKTAAKDLILFSRNASAVEKMVNASAGYDLPAFEKLTDFKIWAEIGPPPGTLYHYPNPYNHQILSVAAQPAPPKIAHQIYTQAIHTKMIVRLIKGEAMEKTLAWAEGELEGFMRELTRARQRSLLAPRCGGGMGRGKATPAAASLSPSRSDDRPARFGRGRRWSIPRSKPRRWPAPCAGARASAAGRCSANRRSHSS